MLKHSTWDASIVVKSLFINIPIAETPIVYLA